MPVRLLRVKWFWAVAFGALFALSIDLWAWDWSSPAILGLPYAIVYFVLLEGALFVLFALFIKCFWTGERGEG